MQKSITTLALAAALLTLTACSSLKFPGVYRVTVQQGNVIDQEMVDQLEVGMSRRQVRYVMGTPLIEDTFNPDRWDYYYSLRRGDGSLIKKHTRVVFDGEVLASIEGDMEPTVPTISPEEVREQLENEDTEMPVERFDELDQ